MSLGHRPPSLQTSFFSIWAIAPGLGVFLQKFEQLSVLEIVVSIEDRDPLEFEALLLIYDLCGKKTLVEFTMPNTPGAWDTVISKWSFAWEECLRTSGRI